MSRGSSLVVVGVVFSYRNASAGQLALNKVMGLFYGFPYAMTMRCHCQLCPESLPVVQIERLAPLAKLYYVFLGVPLKTAIPTKRSHEI